MSKTLPNHGAPESFSRHDSSATSDADTIAAAHSATDSFSRHDPLNATDTDTIAPAHLATDSARRQNPLSATGSGTLTAAGSESPCRTDRGISWGAIFAGAAAGAALWLVLSILGVGLGLSTVSPWRNEGISAATFGASTILWLSLTHLLAAGLGGYLAGRFRTGSLAVSMDESRFRDTAHGFLSWAVALLVSAAVLMSAVSPMVGTGMQAGVAGGVVAAQVFIVGPDNGQVGSDPTALPQPDAQQGLGETSARLEGSQRETGAIARDGAEVARKAATYAAFWAFVSLLVGAAIASLAGTLGGRQRAA